MPSLSEKAFAFRQSCFRDLRDRILDARKQKLLLRLEGTVAEIGFGAGNNAKYYGPRADVIGIEPNRAIHDSAREYAKRLGKHVTLYGGTAEHLPLNTGTMDAIVTTHVLCSVDDISASLKEILKALKPGGVYCFYEHVGAEDGTWTRWFQDRINGAHSRIYQGCECNRDIEIPILEAGFSEVSLERFNQRTVFRHLMPHIVGRAVK